MKNPQKIAEPKGKLGILLVGLGAVSTTTIAGVLAIRKGLAKPIGSLTQMGAIRLGKRTENRSPLIKDFVPLASLDDVVFGGWDIFEDNAYEAAKTAGVLDKDLLEQIRPELEAIKPIRALGGGLPEGAALEASELRLLAGVGRTSGGGPEQDRADGGAQFG